MRKADILTRAGTEETLKPTLLTNASEQMWRSGLGSRLQPGGTRRGHPLWPAGSPRWEPRRRVLVSVQGYLWQPQLAAQCPALATLPLANQHQLHWNPRKKGFAGQTQHIILFVKG